MAQRSFGVFPKIHPFLRSESLKATPTKQLLLFSKFLLGGSLSASGFKCRLHVKRPFIAKKPLWAPHGPAGRLETWTMNIAESFWRRNLLKKLKITFPGSLGTWSDQPDPAWYCHRAGHCNALEMSDLCWKDHPIQAYHSFPRANFPPYTTSSKSKYLHEGKY